MIAPLSLSSMATHGMAPDDILPVFNWLLDCTPYTLPQQIEEGKIQLQGINGGRGSCAITAHNFIECCQDKTVPQWDPTYSEAFCDKSLMDLIIYHCNALDSEVCANQHTHLVKGCADCLLVSPTWTVFKSIWIHQIWVWLILVSLDMMIITSTSLWCVAPLQFILLFALTCDTPISKTIQYIPSLQHGVGSYHLHYHNLGHLRTATSNLPTTIQLLLTLSTICLMKFHPT